MSEYTKEQEAEALAHVETLLRPEPHHKHLRIVLATAKRTAEAEAKLEASRAGSDYNVALAKMTQLAHGLESERDALKTRVAELEGLRDEIRVVRKLYVEQQNTLCSERDALKARVAELERALSEADNDRDALRDMVRETPAPLVIVTREMLEMMLADAETRAVYGYGRGDVPLNPAARLVVALRKMLEEKP